LAFATFVGQQPLFGWQTTTKSSQFAAGTYHSVAGNNDWNRIRAIGRANRAAGLGVAKTGIMLDQPDIGC